MATTTTRRTGAERLALHERFGMDASTLLARGSIAGLVGGLAFIIANFYYLDNQGKPAIAPLFAISTIFRFSDVPVTEPPEAILGLVTHLSLSVLFGIVFAFLAALVVRNAVTLVVGSLAYGLLLYAVNFQIFGRFIFTWFTDPRGPDQLFELWIHPVAYGLFLAPFFLPLAARGSTRA